MLISDMYVNIAIVFENSRFYDRKPNFEKMEKKSKKVKSTFFVQSCIQSTIILQMFHNTARFLLFSAKISNFWQNWRQKTF